ncbi:MAG: CopD family protein [Anaerolineae bacterium]|nr:CopD family protein [Anaerolineae bacterium]MDW8173419.1 CopD family protein [Anaerolineae bacterium]
MTTSSLALSLFFHILATVVWVGGLLLTVLLVWPEVRRVLENQPSLYRLLSRWRQRFAPISNLALATLVVTGLIQMSLDEYYEGFMSFENEWSRVMLAKHIAIVLMALVGLVLQYSVVPALERASLLVERGKGDPQAWAKLRRREVRLTWLSVSLGLLVLGLSAWAAAL